MSSVPLVPIQRLIHDVTGDLHVVVAASEQGFRETALEACLLAKEKLQAIREELLRPEPGIADRGTVMTACKKCPLVVSDWNRSRMALPSSGCAGSTPV